MVDPYFDPSIDSQYNQQVHLLDEGPRGSRMRQFTKDLHQGTQLSVETGLELRERTGEERLKSFEGLPYSRYIQETGPTDWRAEQQSTAAKWANVLPKFGTIAATSFLDSTVGTIWGGLEALAAWDKNRFVDNRFTRTMLNTQEAVEAFFPTYRTYAETEAPWYRRLGTANFWADVVVNQGFTAGTILAMALTGSALGALNRGIAAFKLGRGTYAAANANRLKDVMRGLSSGKLSPKDVPREVLSAAQYLKNSDPIVQILASLHGSTGYARIEATSHAKELHKELESKYREDWQQRLPELTNNLIIELATKNPDMPRESLMPLVREQLEREYADGMREIDQIIAAHTNITFATDLLYLTLTNQMMWGKFASANYKLARPIDAKMIKRRDPSDLLKGVDPALKTPMQKAFMGAGQILKNPTVQFFEESFLHINRETSGDFHSAIYNQEGTDDINEYMDAYLSTMIDTFGNIDNWESGMMGFIGGFLGGIGPRTRSGRVTGVEGRGGIWEIPTALKRARNYNDLATVHAEYLNQKLSQPEIQAMYRSAVRRHVLDQRAREGLLTGDELKFKIEATNSFINDFLLFDELGLGNEFLEIVQMHNKITPETARQVLALKNTDREGNVTYSDPFEGISNSELSMAISTQAARFERLAKVAREYSDNIDIMLGIRNFNEQDSKLVKEQMIYYLASINNMRELLNEVKSEGKLSPHIQTLLNNRLLADESGDTKEAKRILSEVVSLINSNVPEVSNVPTEEITKAAYNYIYLLGKIARLTELSEALTTDQGAKDYLNRIEAIRKKADEANSRKQSILEGDKSKEIEEQIEKTNKELDVEQEQLDQDKASTLTEKEEAAGEEVDGWKELKDKNGKTTGFEGTFIGEKFTAETKKDLFKQIEDRYKELSEEIQSRKLEKHEIPEAKEQIKNFVETNEREVDINNIEQSASEFNPDPMKPFKGTMDAFLFTTAREVHERDDQESLRTSLNSSDLTKAHNAESQLLFQRLLDKIANEEESGTITFKVVNKANLLKLYGKHLSEQQKEWFKDTGVFVVALKNGRIYLQPSILREGKTPAYSQLRESNGLQVKEVGNRITVATSYGQDFIDATKRLKEMKESGLTHGEAVKLLTQELNEKIDEYIEFRKPILEGKQTPTYGVQTINPGYISLGEEVNTFEDVIGVKPKDTKLVVAIGHSTQIGETIISSKPGLVYINYGGRAIPTVRETLREADVNRVVDILQYMFSLKANQKDAFNEAIQAIKDITYFVYHSKGKKAKEEGTASDYTFFVQEKSGRAVNLHIGKDVIPASKIADNIDTIKNFLASKHYQVDKSKVNSERTIDLKKVEDGKLVDDVSINYNEWLLSDKVKVKLPKQQPSTFSSLTNSIVYNRSVKLDIPSISAAKVYAKQQKEQAKERRSDKQVIHKTQIDAVLLDTKEGIDFTKKNDGLTRELLEKADSAVMSNIKQEGRQIIAFDLAVKTGNKTVHYKGVEFIRESKEVAKPVVKEELKKEQTKVEPEAQVDKRADIEKIRKEKRGKALEAIGVDERQFDGSKFEPHSNAKEYSFERAVTLAGNKLNANPLTKIGSLPMDAANAIQAELHIAGIKATDKTPLSEIIDKLNEINAKYNAELAELDKQQAITPEKEGKTIPTEVKQEADKLSTKTKFQKREVRKPDALKKTSPREETDSEEANLTVPSLRGKSTTMEFQKERAEVLKVFPDLIITETIRRIEARDGREAQARVIFSKTGRTRVEAGKKAPVGTLWHEGGHEWIRRHITPEERISLLEEVAAEAGNKIYIIEGNEVTFEELRKTLTSEQFYNTVEEFLMEEFRDYVNSKGTYRFGKSQAKASIFRRMWDWVLDLIKHFTGKDFSNKSGAEIVSVFDNILANQWTESTVVNRPSEVLFKVGEFNSHSSNILVKHFNSHFFDVVFSKEVFNEIDFTNLSDYLIYSYDLTYNHLVDLLDQEYDQVIATILENWDSVMVEHSKFLRQYRIDIRLPQDVIDDSKLTKDNTQYIQSNLVNVKDTMPSEIKLLIAGLTDKNVRISGHNKDIPITTDFASTTALLLNRLAGISSEVTMANRLADMATQYPHIAEFMNRLGIDSEGSVKSDLSFKELRLLVKAFKFFHKYNSDMFTTLITQEGDIYTVSLDETTRKTAILDSWKSNIKNNTKNTPFKLEAGRYMFDSSKDLTLNGISIKASKLFNLEGESKDILLQAKDFNMSTDRFITEIAKMFGIELKVDKNNNFFVGEGTANRRRIAKNFIMFLQSELRRNFKEGNAVYADSIFDKSTIKVNKELSLLSNELAKFDANIKDNQIITDKGTEYSIQEKTGLHRIFDFLENKEVPKELEPFAPVKDKEGNIIGYEGNLETFNSVWYEMAMRGETPSIVILRNMGKEVGDKIDISDLKPGDLYSMEINNILEGTFAFPRSETRGIEYAANFGRSHINKNISKEQMITQMRKYLTSEVLTALAHINDPNSRRLVSSTRGKAYSLVAFRNIVPELSSVLQEAWNDSNKGEVTNELALLESSEWLNAAETIVNDNLDYINDSISEYLDKKSQEMVDRMIELKLVVPSTNLSGTSVYKTIGISDSVLNNALRGEVTKHKFKASRRAETTDEVAITADQLARLASLANYYYSTGVIEFTKLVTGNISTYLNNDISNFHKRTTTFTSTVSGNANNRITVDALNRHAKRIDGTLHDHNRKTWVIADVKVQSELIDILSDFLTNEDLRGYKEGGMNEADGQTYATLDGYRSAAIRTDIWNDNYERTWQYEAQYGFKLLAKREIDAGVPVDRRKYTPLRFEQLFKEHLPTNIPLSTAFSTNTSFFNGEAITIQEAASNPLPVLKLQGTGQIITNGFEKFNSRSITKTSIAPLLPSVIEYKPTLLSLFEQATNSGKDMISFESAEKGERLVNSEGKHTPLYIQEGESWVINNLEEADRNGELLTTEVSWSNIGNQLDIDPSGKESVTDSSQKRSLTFVDVFSLGKEAEQFTHLKEAFEEYTVLQNELVKRAREKFLSDIGVEVKEGPLTVTQFEKLKEVINEELTSRLIPDNVYEGAQLVLEASNKLFDTLPNKRQLVNLMQGLFRSRAISIKRKGDMLTQLAVTGFESNNRKSLVGSSDTLKSYVPLDSSGQPAKSKAETVSIAPSEAIITLPRSFIPFIERNFKGSSFNEKLKAFNEAYSQRKLKNMDLFDKIFTFAANRIPGQSINSIEVLRVKEFISPTAGSVVILSSEIVTKAGSDFDIDKLTSYFNSITFDSDSYPAYVEYVADQKELNSKAAIENRLNEITAQVVLDPANYAALMKPNGAGIIKSQADNLINKKENIANIADLTSLDFNLRMAESQWGAVAMVGVLAVHTTSHSKTQGFPIRLSEDVFGNLFDLHHTAEGENNMGHVFDHEDNKISETNASGISAAVDAGKESNPAIFQINYTSSTANAYQLLNRVGRGEIKPLGFKLLTEFFTSPIILEYEAQRKIQESQFLENSPYRESKKDTIARILGIPSEIINEKTFLYEVLGGLSEVKTQEDITKMKSIVKEKVETFIRDNGSLKQSEFKTNKEKVLQVYLYYIELGKYLSTLQDIMRPDTGLPKDATTLRLKRLRKKRLFDLGIFNNGDIQNLTNNSFIREFQAVHDNAFDVQRQFDLSTISTTLDNILWESTDAVMKIYTDPLLNIPETKLADIAQRLQNAFVTSVIHLTPTRGEALSNHYKRLFQGNENQASFAKRLSHIKALFPDNKFLNDLIPVISEFNNKTQKNLDIDYVKLFSGKMAVEDSNSTTESIRELYDSNQPEVQEFLDDLMIMSLLESGTQVSPFSFFEVLPAERYQPLVQRIFDEFLNLENIGRTGTIVNQRLTDRVMGNFINNARIVPPVVLRGKSYYRAISNIKTDKNGRLAEGTMDVPANYNFAKYRYVRLDHTTLNKAQQTKLKAEGKRIPRESYLFKEVLDEAGNPVITHPDNSNVPLKRYQLIPTFGVPNKMFEVGETSIIRENVHGEVINNVEESYYESQDNVERWDLLESHELLEDYSQTTEETTGKDISNESAFKARFEQTTPTTQQTNQYYEGDITPSPNTVFVFGSNPEGRHGAGAAKVARTKFGAIYGQGEGLQGNAYALPTKDLRITKNKGFKSISPEQITSNIQKLYRVAEQNPSKQFKVAYRNTDKMSLNGYTGFEMIEMFNAAGTIPSNIVFSKEWFATGKLNLQTTQQTGQELLQPVEQTDSFTFQESETRNTPDIIIRLSELKPSTVFNTTFNDLTGLLGITLENVIHDNKKLNNYELFDLLRKLKSNLDGNLDKSDLSEGTGVLAMNLLPNTHPVKKMLYKEVEGTQAYQAYVAEQSETSSIEDIKNQALGDIIDAYLQGNQTEIKLSGRWRVISKDLKNILKVEGALTEALFKKANDTLSNIIEKEKRTGEKYIKDKFFSESDQAPLSNLLDIIINENHPLRELAEFVKSKLVQDVEANLVEKIVSPKGEEYSGLYRSKTRDIQISRTANHTKGVELTIVHEGLHAISYDTIAKEGEVSKDFNILYEAAKNHFGNVEYEGKFYPLRTSHEFLVGLFSNSEFIRELIKAPPVQGMKEYKNLFTQVWDYILRVLGLTKETNFGLYNQAFNVATHIITQDFNYRTIIRDAEQRYNEMVESLDYVSIPSEYTAESNKQEVNRVQSDLVKAFEGLAGKSLNATTKKIESWHKSELVPIANTFGISEDNIKSIRDLRNRTYYTLVVNKPSTVDASFAEALRQNVPMLSEISNIEMEGVIKLIEEGKIEIIC